LKRLISILLFLFFTLRGLALATTYQDISDIGTSAGIIGLGNVSGFTESASVLLENPGGLSIAGNSGSLFYTQLFGDISYFTGAVSFKLNDRLTLGLGCIYEDDGSIDVTGENDDGEAISSSVFNAHVAQYVVGMDYGLTPDYNLGLTWTQYHRSQYTLEGNGGDLGIGFKSKFSWIDIILFGKNVLGQKVSYNNNAYETLQTEIGVSFKTTPLDILGSPQLFGQAKQLTQTGILLKGAGVRFFPTQSDIIGLNIGYKEKHRIGTTLRSLFCGGITLKLEGLMFEYGYDTTDIFQQENQHYFSLALTY